MKVRLAILLPALSLLTAIARGDEPRTDDGPLLHITVKGIPIEERRKIDGFYSIGKDGTLRLPLLTGPIKAAGVSTAELGKMIAKAYHDERIFENVTVEVANGGTSCGPANPPAQIGGQVMRPGPIPYERGLTLARALEQAGGRTKAASANRVILYRAGKCTTLNPGTSPSSELILQPGDAIEVPEGVPESK